MPSVGAFTDPSVDPESGLLANSLGITDADGLRLAEADYSSLGLATLLRSGFRPSYTPEDLRAIHRELFGAVYPWWSNRAFSISSHAPFNMLAGNLPPIGARKQVGIESSDQRRRALGRHHAPRGSKGLHPLGLPGAGVPKDGGQRVNIDLRDRLEVVSPDLS